MTTRRGAAPRRAGPRGGARIQARTLAQSPAVDNSRKVRPANGWTAVPQLATPWQDTISAERPGWRQRAANLDDEFAFAVDYQICRRCRLGWVEQPHTLQRYHRCGLATAGLAALRAEHPGPAWHTLGGHLGGSQPFWAAVGTDVPGGYQQHSPCPHVTGNG
jgi:hypothetical protein